MSEDEFLQTLFIKAKFVNGNGKSN